MKLCYKDVLCETGKYRTMGEDKPALYFISSPNQETMLAAGFQEVHYGLWVKLLSGDEYQEIRNMLEGIPSR